VKPSTGRALGLLAMVLAAAGVAGASEPRLQVELEPSRFGIEDTARLVVRIIEPPPGVSTPQLGKLTNLEVLANVERADEFNLMNGVAIRSLAFTYAVRGHEVGPVAVGEVVVHASDMVLRSQPVAGEVVPGSVVPPRRRAAPFFNDPFADFFGRRRSPQAEVVLRHLLGARKVMVGQPVVAAVVLDTTAGISDFDWVDVPSYPGWWAQRVDPPEHITPEPVEVDGTRFSRFVIARHVLVPLKAGDLTVPAVKARIAVGGRSPFDPGEVLERSTPALQATATQPPPPPAGFAGAVGDLSYSAELRPTKIELGSSAVLSIHLSGSGNLPLVDSPPHWPAADGCTTYPPEDESKVDVGDGGIRGSRTWRMTVVPERAGTLHFEPVTMAVFDPASGAYHRQTLGPFTLHVTVPPPTPTPVPALDAVPPAPPPASQPEGEVLAPTQSPQWLLVVGGLLGGAVLGGLVVWAVGRRRRSPIPPARPGQSPAERARELQIALERWWVAAREGDAAATLRPEMEALRRDLEAVRFAPERADHSDTVRDLATRLVSLFKRA